MVQNQEIKLGNITLSFHEPVNHAITIRSLIGILKSEVNSVSIARKLRDSDKIREQERVNE